MRRNHGRSGLSLGTIVMLTITALVLIGCAMIFPKLMGNIAVRVDVDRVAVAIDDSLKNLRGEPTAVRTAAPAATPATAPPSALATAVPPEATKSVVTKRVTLTAAGAVNIDGSIQKACTSESGYSFDGLFDQIASRFASDINLVTLENTVIATDKLTDVNIPQDALTALASNGVNTICTGFDGILNGGIDGLTATIEAMKAAQISAYGTYTSAENRKRPMTLTIDGLTLAFLSYQGDLTSTGKKQTTQEEQAFAIAPVTLPTIATDILSARASGAQIVVVSLCWGKSGATEPTSTQRELAQGIADAGADVILGTHSQAVQTVEMLTGTRSDGSTHDVLCAYSLGNLLHSDREKRTSISGILLHVGMTFDYSTDRLTFDALSYTPTYVWRGKENGKTAYRVVQSNAQAGAFMGDDQQKVMARCLELIQDVMKDTVVSEQP